MKKIEKYLPAGTRDLIFESAEAQMELERKLLGLYTKLGYRPVITPLLEYYDVFDHNKRYLDEENIFKFSDNAGRLVALRPDNTSPIARVVMSSLKNEPLPLKLCYSQDVFRNTSAYNAKRTQILQSGVEIVGGEESAEDLCCIFTALEALKCCGGPMGKIELGHAGFFDALLAEYDLSEADEEALRDYVAAKNSSGYSFNLKMTDPRAVKLAQELPRLCGDSSVLARARRLTRGNVPAEAILDYIQAIYRCFEEAGYGDALLIDLGLVQSINYYTGIVFKGYIGGVGSAVISGGRYDNLIDSFGESASACGFALDLSEVMSVIKTEKVAPIALSFADGADSIRAAQAYLQETEA